MIKALRFAVAALAASTVSAAAMDPGDPAKGEQDFKRCAVCHNIGPNATIKVGPPLNGIVGRQIGSWEGYSYGKATKEKGADGTVWTEDMLFTYLADPAAFVGGASKMPMKFPDEQFRRDVITYLAQFNIDGEKK
ncbi:c-type cytochrome [Amorphus orientalis]|uniref:Cytochrome c n=1 Tax=Amorphus orientalis TaxID=649198 RepID=A0AAE3VP17_9HYPH|nr:c-type cytochrome [Amorphus orientalis]MDQ0315472.1 cytochrome c [Amorphus orientalis]